MSSAQVYEIAFRLGASVNSSMRSSFNNATSQLSNLETRSGLTNKSFKLLATGALAAATAIGGLTVGIGAAIKANDEFNSSMKQIQASTGTSLEAMKEIKETAKNLYNNTYGEDWNDLAESISTVKSVTGLAGKALETATANAITYRDVWGEEVSQSIKATDTMMRNFGITSDQAYNLMAQGAQKGLNKSDELIDSANEYAPYFAKLGFNANQMFDTFSAGLQNGAFNLDKVGDAVKEFGIRSKDGSKTSMEAYAMLGLSGEKMTQTFAKGGPAAQKAFNQVVEALKKVKNPADQNTAAVGLFGTQAEDLEMKVITSMGNVQSQFDMTRQTMEQVKNIKYDTLGMAFQGIARQIETGFLIPIGEKLLPIVTNLSKRLGYAIPTIQKIFSSAGDRVGSFVSIATNGFGVIRDFLMENGPAILSVASKIFGSISGIFVTVFKIVAPILSKIGQFAMDIFRQIGSFWAENGPQILQAVQNLFSGINKVIQFLAPVITFILETVWGNVKGVIQGAISVILGVIKVFAGIFTGDFSKMWEGAKQIFVGGIQFIWNAVNLLFIGKILTGIRSLASGAIGRVGGMWGSITKFFTEGTTSAWGTVTGLIPKMVNGFNLIKTKVVNIIQSMTQAISSRYAQIVQGATSLPGKIGAGIKAMGGLALKGITSLGNTMLSGIGKVVNGVIKGINWVSAKVGIDTKINEWAVPQYARGTSGHPGGLAILGDGGGPELYRTPNGQMGLSPGTDTLMNLPKGTQVIPARETSLLLSQMGIPAYKDGTLSNAFSKGKEWFTSGVSKVKDVALDVFSYISSPAKLLNKVLQKFGVDLPSIAGTFGDIAKGSFNMVKDKAKSFLTEKLKGFTAGSGAGGVAAPAQVQSWLMAAIQATGVPSSWLGPLQTMAMKESGGNPRAINLWDSNAKRGTPSKGLMQTIDSTFNAYKLPGMNDIWNPIHNAVVAIRYMQGRYGSIFNTPGMRNMAKGGGYKGYYKGGKVPNSQWAWVGEQGPELMRIPGGSKVFDHEKSKGMISGIADYANGNTGGGSQEETNVTFQFNPQINLSGSSVDEDSILETLRNVAYPEFMRMVKECIQEQQNAGRRLRFSE
ncbi:transglycosylase SLT domain-containing protein [Bacillus infantis]|uniref:Transglycosylase SLT domain-containing protein n=1 Tax=Bacillus infantis TaxID=324767 RepID=A0A5D4SSS4_9BACI|nr:phage tail tape measure protein [Bacillus infantis]TYS66373.1 transglycosylase SLT domain-containing protein [Bacillus infantis]